MRRFSASVAVSLWPNKQHLSTSGPGSHPFKSTSDVDHNHNTSNDHPDESYAKFHLPAKSIVGTFAMCFTLPFLIGYFGPLLVLRGFGVMPNYGRHRQGAIMSGSGIGVVLPSQPQRVVTEAEMKASNEERLPIPTVDEDKHVPLTLYTSKMFPSAGSATSNTVQIDRSSSAYQVKSKVISDSNVSSHHVSNQQELEDLSFDIREEEEEEEEHTNDYSHNSDADGLHLPAGQHLLVDIKNVDSSFLNSEHRLATAMVELITASKLTLLSYHCQ